MSFTVALLPSPLDGNKLLSRFPLGSGPDPATLWVLEYGIFESDHTWTSSGIWSS